MKNVIHPVLPLSIIDGTIQSPAGVIGHVDHGKDFVYVCFYEHTLIVVENDNFDSVLTRLVTEKIHAEYYYAFKILCKGGVTATVKWVKDDVVLIGVISGTLGNGEIVWTPSAQINNWPGLKE